MFCLPVLTLIYLWEIYIFQGSVCLFCCWEICGPILGLYKSLTDTWMWKFGLKPWIPRKGIHKWDFPCSAADKSCSAASYCSQLPMRRGSIRVRAAWLNEGAAWLNGWQVGLRYGRPGLDFHPVLHLRLSWRMHLKVRAGDLPSSGRLDTQHVKRSNVCFFGGLECVMATPLLMSSILYFWGDVWIRESCRASRRSTNLATHIVMFCTGSQYFFFAVRLKRV